MASGHEVPHQQAGHMAAPTKLRITVKENPCQGGAVHTWHIADLGGFDSASLSPSIDAVTWRVREWPMFH